MNTEIIVALIMAAGTFIGSYYGYRKSADKMQAIIDFRLAEIEKRVDKHNNLIERTYALEKKQEINEERIRSAHKRIDTIENK